MMRIPLLLIPGVEVQGKTVVFLGHGAHERGAVDREWICPGCGAVLFRGPPPEDHERAAYRCPDCHTLSGFPALRGTA